MSDGLTDALTQKRESKKRRRDALYRALAALDVLLREYDYDNRTSFILLGIHGELRRLWKKEVEIEYGERHEERRR